MRCRRLRSLFSFFKLAVFILPSLTALSFAESLRAQDEENSSPSLPPNTITRFQAHVVGELGAKNNVIQPSKVGGAARMVDNVQVQKGPVLASAGLGVEFSVDDEGNPQSAIIHSTLIAAAQKINLTLKPDPLKIIKVPKVADFISGMYSEVFFKGRPELETFDGVLQNWVSVGEKLKPKHMAEAEKYIQDLMDSPDKLKEAFRGVLEDPKDESNEMAIKWKTLSDEEKEKYLQENIDNGKFRKLVEDNRVELVDGAAGLLGLGDLLQELVETFPEVAYDLDENGNIKSFLPAKQYLDFIGAIYPYSQIDSDDENAILGPKIELFHTTDEVARVATALANRKGTWFLQHEFQFGISKDPSSNEMVIDVRSTLVPVKMKEVKTKDSSGKQVVEQVFERIENETEIAGVVLDKSMPRPMNITPTVIAGALNKMKLLTDEDGNIPIGSAVLYGMLGYYRDSFAEPAMKQAVKAYQHEAEKFKKEIVKEHSVENGAAIIVPVGELQEAGSEYVDSFLEGNITQHLQQKTSVEVGNHSGDSSLRLEDLRCDGPTASDIDEILQRGAETN